MESIYQKNRRIIIWNDISKNNESFAVLTSDFIKQWEKQSIQTFLTTTYERRRYDRLMS